MAGNVDVSVSVMMKLLQRSGSTRARQSTTRGAFEISAAGADRSARSGVLESLRRGATPRGAHSERVFTPLRCGEDSWPTSVPEASRPSSGRPSTRQSARLREVGLFI